MNFVPARVADGEIMLASGTSAGTASAGLTEGRQVIAGFRPEDIRLSDTGIPASVVLVEPTGAETQLTLRSGDDALVLTTRDRISVSPGDLVHVSVAQGKLHCFDPKTEMSLAKDRQAE